MSDAARYSLRTGELAEALGLSARTVATLIDRGELKGWRLRGRGDSGERDRRVHLEDALRYARERGIPPDRLHALARRLGMAQYAGPPAVLVVSPDPPVAHAAAEAGVACVSVAVDGLAAVEQARQRRFDAVLVDAALGRQEALRLAGWLREHFPGLALGVLANEDDGPDAWRGYRAWQKPVEPERVVKALLAPAPRPAAARANGSGGKAKRGRKP